MLAHSGEVVYVCVCVVYGVCVCVSASVNAYESEYT